MTKLDAALAMAAKGYAVFPLVPNDKTPAIKNWQNEATTHSDAIARWWRDMPDANIGHPTVNECTIDIDPRHGGKDTFEALTLSEDFPKTSVVETQGKGNHVYYALPPHTIVKGGTSKLGPGVDIKSWGGYVVAPGSTIDGRPYRWLNDRPIAKAPQWLIDRCNAHRPRTDAAGERLVDEDDTAVTLAQHWLDKHAPDATLGDIDDTAFKVAARFYDFGVSPGTARELLTEWSELHAFPPMQPDRIAVVAASAGRNRDNAIGVRHPDVSGFEPVDIEQHKHLATAWRPVDVSTLKKRDWVIPDVACKQNVGMLAGPAGVSKTTFILMFALAAITGRSDILGIPVAKQSRVWLWNQEDDLDELQRRLAAAMLAFSVSDADMADAQGKSRLFLNSGVDKPLLFATRVDRVVRRTAHVDAVIAEIIEHQIDLAIFDPLVEFHQAEENDNVQMRVVLGTIRDVAVKANCAAYLCAHTRKPDMASSKGFAGEMDSVRGASAQLGVIRTLFTLNTASPKDAKDWTMPGSHLSYVRYDMAKNNLAAMWSEPRWFHRESVIVGGINGESVGVLRPIVLKRAAPAGLADILEPIGRALLNIEPAGGSVFADGHTALRLPLSGIVARMPDVDAAMFKTPKGESDKNVQRKIKKAFDGHSVYQTNAGKLHWSGNESDKKIVFWLTDPLVPHPLSEEGQEVDV